jgi:hypothetical protein
VGRTSIAAILVFFGCPSPMGWCDLNLTPLDKWNPKLLSEVWWGWTEESKEQTGVPSYPMHTKVYKIGLVCESIPHWFRWIHSKSEKSIGF